MDDIETMGFLICNYDYFSVAVELIFKDIWKGKFVEQLRSIIQVNLKNLFSACEQIYILII